MGMLHMKAPRSSGELSNLFWQHTTFASQWKGCNINDERATVLQVKEGVRNYFNNKLVTAVQKPSSQASSG
jgi:hypothetical protein